MATLNTLNICLLGKTGYGKSSLINGMFGTRFSTDPFYSCTKELYTVTTMKDAPKGYDAIAIYDTPGIGEFPDDTIYQNYYDHAVSLADVIVLVVTFSRTDAPEQELLLNIKKYINDNKDVRFVIALNHIDSTKVALDTEYRPWNDDANEPSQACISLIHDRIRIIHEKFDDLFMKSIVVPVCAMRSYGIETLKQIILDTNKNKNK